MESPSVKVKRGTEHLEEYISSTGEEELDRIETLEEDIIAEDEAEAEDVAEANKEAAETYDEEKSEDGEYEDDFPVPPSPGSVRAYPYPYAIRVPQFHHQDGEWKGGEGHPPPLPPPPPTALHFRQGEGQVHTSYPPH